MFEFNNNKNEESIFASQSGEVIAIENVPDEVFSQKMLGDGVAIIPTTDEVCSPIDGIIVQISDTLHAYGIQSKDGLEILIHIGINTVELKGKGFECLVKKGDKVKKGDIIAKSDLNFIKLKGYDIHTSILITNIDNIKSFNCNLGNAIIGKTSVIKYKK